jgi:hypothetical protein
MQHLLEQNSQKTWMSGFVASKILGQDVPTYPLSKNTLCKMPNTLTLGSLKTFYTSQH